MRLFIAIDLPESVKEHLRKVQSILPEAEMSKTRDFHLTLKFLGECDDATRAKIEKELEQVKFEPFEAQLTDVGFFGGRIPRVVWIGMRTPERLAQTARDIENRVARFGFPKEYRFTPHITLARIRFIANPQKFLEDAQKIKVRPLKFSVSQFHLYSSRFSLKGAVHEKLRSYSVMTSGGPR